MVPKDHPAGHGDGKPKQHAIIISGQVFQGDENQAIPNHPISLYPY